MGIVAFCPNGHRINVKASLAGRKGLCPTCGAKFRIVSGTGATPPGRPPARLIEADPATIAALPRALPFDAADARPAEAIASIPPPVETPFAAGTSPPALHPALAERTELQWCIAFPGGDPTEPLSAESMQAWLDSGQIEGSEVVWRSDWSEWRAVRDVFPDVIG